MCFPAVQDGAGLLPAYRGTLDALRQIVRQEGWRALYSGKLEKKGSLQRSY